MAAESSICQTPSSKRIAVVTGANKGIGLEICRHLAGDGVAVVVTSRDEKRGLEALQNLKASGLSDQLIFFHQLDVTDSASTNSLADFVLTRFGKLDILVNNAGIGGIHLDGHALGEAVQRVGGWPFDEELWKVIAPQSLELAKDCLETNYYGAKMVTEALLPLLQLSTSARIVNVSSSLGMLKFIPGEWIRQSLDDAENLTEDVIDGVMEAFMEDFREGRLDSRGWPITTSAYKLSKAAMNAYTRVLAKKFPSFMVNSVCPGFVKTDITGNNGVLMALEGAESPVRLALLQENGPSGFFFHRKEISPF